MTVTVDDPAQIDVLEPELLDAGFPSVDTGLPVGTDLPGMTRRFGSADPALGLNLYLTVRDAVVRGSEPGG
jgi:hypothetical protein